MSDDEYEEEVATLANARHKLIAKSEQCIVGGRAYGLWHRHVI